MTTPGDVTMSPSSAIDAILNVPYQRGGGSWSGIDCFGVVELWYRHVLGIEVDDRGARGPGHASVQQGRDAVQHWQEVSAPVDHCLVLMRAGRHPAGHIGIYYGGSILHSDESHGCVYEPANGPFIRPRITGYLVRK